MPQQDDPKQPEPDASDIDRTVSQQAKQQPVDKPEQGGKPDEGIRPEDLTSENDGGAEG